jgi:hypothetical protein
VDGMAAGGAVQDAVIVDFQRQIDEVAQELWRP